MSMHVRAFVCVCVCGYVFTMGCQMNSADSERMTCMHVCVCVCCGMTDVFGRQRENDMYACMCVCVYVWISIDGKYRKFQAGQLERLGIGQTEDPDEASVLPRFLYTYTRTYVYACFRLDSWKDSE